MSEHRARQLVYARSAGVCERCGQSRATEWHHRRNRSQGGRWTAANGLHLCGGCHRWITEHPDEAAEAGRGWVVWAWQNPVEVPVRHAVYGLVVLDDCGGMTLTLDAELHR